MAVSPPLSFDPRQVPVSRVDSDLPPVPHARLLPEALRQRFAAPPDWAPEVVREPRFGERAPAQAAVLIPIVQRDLAEGGPTILLTLRTAHLSTHSGQIAFPGGKVDRDDASVRAAALREAHEEVGLEPRHAEVIGELPVYVTGTGFHVTPVVALVQPPLPPAQQQQRHQVAHMQARRRGVESAVQGDRFGHGFGEHARQAAAVLLTNTGAPVHIADVIASINA